MKVFACNLVPLLFCNAGILLFGKRDQRGRISSRRWSRYSRKILLIKFPRYLLMFWPVVLLVPNGNLGWRWLYTIHGRKFRVIWLQDSGRSHNRDQIPYHSAFHDGDTIAGNYFSVSSTCTVAQYITTHTRSSSSKCSYFSQRLNNTVLMLHTGRCYGRRTR